jgi:glucose/arabinose dehydrogenase/mono/diheme cytochrome c family protein
MGQPSCRSGFDWAATVHIVAAMHHIAALLFLLAVVSVRSAENEAQLQRGRALYLANCLLCHQVTGQGTPGVFPPLAKSDYLANDRRKAILGVLEGVSGPITVNGRKYNGTMPPVNLKDQEVADVFTFILNNWGNPGGSVTAEEVKEIRAESKFPTYEALVAANSFAPLPPAPAGYALREVIRLPDHGLRLVPDQDGKAAYVLGGNGNVWHLDPKTSALTQILWGKNYLNKKGDNTSTWGLARDSKNRFFVVANRREETGAMVTNFVTIYRSTAHQDGHPSELKPWFDAAYPWGVGPFNHCVNQAAIGPDGMLYVNSGSRTDGNEPGEDPRFWKGGEHPLTACIWRFDPNAEKPELEIYARGLRNAFGFCWNEAGEMFATDNGPDAHVPEELNRIERGKHYGFPFQFSNLSHKPYAYTPEPPAGVTFTHPVANLGPDAGYEGKPISTFHPHSSPAGLVYLPRDFPGSLAGSFLVTRFGNLLKTEHDVGFDVVQVRLREESKTAPEGSFTTILAPLGRPIDLCILEKNKVLILEYSRPTNNAGALGFPGRVLELSAATPSSP